uniref:Peptidyl-prolyl cis-trans isomerase n=1 Tax=candidate division CPR3 bacterium TaxID=2268181 RepID=A0A7C4LZI9_UNCC3
MKNSTLYLLLAIAIVVVTLIVSIVAGLKNDKKIENQESTTKTQIKTNEKGTEKISIQPVKEDKSGQDLKIETIKEGTGDRITKEGDMISVHYTGTLLDGTKFDSSLDRNQPFSFDLGMSQVIKGWDIGLIGMKIGEKRKLIIPPSMGYGNMAVGDKIPENSTLIFEVELIEIK